MISDDTVFILGAGSNISYGYPTGAGLRRIIIENCAKNELQAFYNNSEHPNDIFDYLISNKKEQKFGTRFDECSNNSIDFYLNNNQELKDIGKLAIAYAIYQIEKTSVFNEKIHNQFQNEDWYKFIFNKMITTIRGLEYCENFLLNRIKFITFNYDRSLEYYIENSFVNSFPEKHENKTRTIAQKFTSSQIIHIYGSIKEQEIQAYGKATIPQNLIKMSNGIKLINERKMDQESLEIIQNHITTAKRIFFLGFGYAEENMEILGFPKILDNISLPAIYGTAKGEAQKKIKEICDQIRPNCYNSIKIENYGCLQLLREYL